MSVFFPYLSFNPVSSVQCDLCLVMDLGIDL